MKEPFYITTPIYYVTDAPHIGHLYSTLACDIMARFQRLLGKDVWFLTGTDEHGQKIQKQAKDNNETPQELADRVVQRYLAAWKRYAVTYDDFIRTTEDRHKKVVQALIQKLMDSGDVYLGEYEGWYCVPCEAYWTETQIVDNKCPYCQRPVEKLREESYFFRMSKYQNVLLSHIDKNPNFIVPETRKNEVLGFIRQGLKDISISRTTIQWGIPMPKDPRTQKEHKVYVWFDALTNYVSALDPLNQSPKMSTHWPVAIHVVGKDILRFHAVYWPTFLLALGLPVPKKIVAHGWLTESQRKISKSFGNAIDPIALADQVGVDGMRYFLFREFVFGQDGEYVRESMIRRINAELANDYGNCLSRVCAMLEKYRGLEIQDSSAVLKMNSPLKTTALEILAPYKANLEDFLYHKALDEVGRLVSRTNRYIEERAPWKLAKENSESSKKDLDLVLLHCHESLRIASLMLLPFIPESATRALASLGGSGALHEKVPFQFAEWGKGPSHFTLTKPGVLFPRLEIPTEVTS